MLCVDGESEKRLKQNKKKKENDTTLIHTHIRTQYRFTF